MISFLYVLAVVFILSVVFVLIKGLINMLKAGSVRVSNKLMQLRILLQFMALLFILLIFLIRLPNLF